MTSKIYPTKSETVFGGRMIWSSSECVDLSFCVPEGEEGDLKVGDDPKPLFNDVHDDDDSSGVIATTTTTVKATTPWYSQGGGEEKSEMGRPSTPAPGEGGGGEGGEEGKSGSALWMILIGECCCYCCTIPRIGNVRGARSSRVLRTCSTVPS